MADNSESQMAEEIDALRSQLALLAGAAVGLVTESYRIHDQDDWPLRYRAPFGSIATLAQILESLPFVQNLPAARPYLDAMAEARRDVAERNDEVRRRLSEAD